MKPRGRKFEEILPTYDCQNGRFSILWDGHCENQYFAGSILTNNPLKYKVLGSVIADLKEFDVLFCRNHF